MADTGNNGAEGESNKGISPELVRKVADRVYEMLRLEMKLDYERQRMFRRDVTNRQRRGR
ncbi:MAG: hypothetical protein KA314_11025 [Chloroflexi bacterium]|nr:hypothetical protein [Chloroflexota bacterium]MBP8056367.1 hypothetical protein [Chloroflexota bacterium]